MLTTPIRNKQTQPVSIVTLDIPSHLKHAKHVSTGQDPGHDGEGHQGDQLTVTGLCVNVPLAMPAWHINAVAKLTSSSPCLSPATLNCPSSSLISLTSRQGRTSQSSLAVLAAVSPLVSEISPAPLLPSYPLLLPQFQEEDVDLLQFLTGGMVASSLEDCSPAAWSS